MDIFDVPAVIRRGEGVEFCTPFAIVRFFENGWEVERGSGEDCDNGDIVLLKARDVKGGLVLKYVDGKIYAVALWEGTFPEAVVASSELELPEWARF